MRCLPQSSFHRSNFVGRGIDKVLVLDAVAPVFETRKVVDGKTPGGCPTHVPLDAQQILAQFYAEKSQLAPVFTPANMIQKEQNEKLVSKMMQR